MRKLKKLLSAALALCMVAGMLTVSASAASNFNFTTPAEPVAIDQTVLTAMTQRAGTEIPLVFGINVVGGNVFAGILQMGGTSVNEIPDPYIWNYNYLYPNAINLMMQSGEKAEGRDLPTDAYYTQWGNINLNNANGLYNSGGANQNFSVALDEFGGVGYAVGTRNDVIIGFCSATVDQIDLVRSWSEGDAFYQEGDENYSPLIIDVQTGSVTSRLYSWAEMGQAISAYLDANPDKSVRYGDPYTIAVNVEEFSAGIPYYIASLIADGTIEKKTAAYVSAIDGYTLTCVDPSNIGTVAADVYGEVHNFNFLIGNYTLADLVAQDVDVIMVAGSGYGYTASTVNNGSTPDTSKQDILADLVELGFSADDIPLVMDANTIQVTLGTNGWNYAPTTPMLMPYIQVYAYMDELNRVNPAINAAAVFQYAIDQFFHVEEAASADVALYYIGDKWDSVDEDYDRVPDLINYIYDKDAIEEAIKTGISYALSGEAEANGNLLLAAYRTNDNAYQLLTEHAASTEPDSSHDYITLVINGQTKYLDLTALAGTEGDDPEESGGEFDYTDVRTEYQAIIDYYNSGKYGYGDDLQTTLQNYADHMVAHVWQPDTSAPDTYGYGLTSSTSSDTPSAPSARFTDVADNAWYANAVAWAVENKITDGTGDGTTFSPTQTCSVGEILTFLWKAAGRPEPESDIGGDYAFNPNAYYYKAMLWALQEGVMQEDNIYDPKADCTRAMAVDFLWKAAGSPDAPEASFSDLPAQYEFAQAVAWAVEQGVTTGTGDGTTFSPDVTCDRGTIVTFLQRDFG